MSIDFSKCVSIDFSKCVFMSLCVKLDRVEGAATSATRAVKMAVDGIILFLKSCYCH